MKSETYTGMEFATLTSRVCMDSSGEYAEKVEVARLDDADFVQVTTYTDGVVQWCSTMRDKVIWSLGAREEVEDDRT